MANDRGTVATMLTSQRKAEILVRLRADGSVVAKELATLWDVSEDTVRRDLRELAAEGLLQRVHGGALPVSPAIASFEVRRNVATAEKAVVARLAAAVVQPNQTVFIDGGTTAVALCSALPTQVAVTVITHSPTVATALLDHPNVELLLIGGRLFRHSVVTMGSIAAEQLAGINVDVFFMGVTGVHHAAGLTTGDAEEAAMKRAICARSSDTYVLASSEKLNAASPFKVVEFSDVTAAITNETRGAALRTLRAAGLRVITPT